MLVCLAISIVFNIDVYVHTGPIMVPQDTNTNNVNDDNPLAGTSSATDMDGKQVYKCAACVDFYANYFL